MSFPSVLNVYGKPFQGLRPPSPPPLKKPQAIALCRYVASKFSTNFQMTWYHVGYEIIVYVYFCEITVYVYVFMKLLITLKFLSNYCLRLCFYEITVYVYVFMKLLFTLCL